MEGYNKDVLKDYVPALVYTMYDGYYIYSPYTNTLSNNEQKDDATYSNGEKIYGLKPYVYYSCRYKKDDIDVVITYTLDNYITIQGKVNGESVYKYGYLLDNIIVNGDSVAYRQISIDEEVTEEFVDSTNKRQYVKINGVKSYKENDGSWYTNLNGEKIRDSNHGNTNKSGKQYYIEAYNFTKWVKNNNIAKLTPQDAVYENGDKFDSKGKSIADNLGWRQ